MTVTNQKLADAFLFASPFIGLLLAGAAIFGGGAIFSALTFPAFDKWDRATVVRICRDGTKVFRMEDGEYRVRTPSYFRSYHAASADVCGS